MAVYQEAPRRTFGCSGQGVALSHNPPLSPLIRGAREGAWKLMAFFALPRGVGIALRAAGLLHFVRAVKMTSLNREPRSACPNKAHKRSRRGKACATWP